jgi:2-polyprenyl-6-hydroxyphenyl methylase/3-demethylubiquinone-9 3-methyltransferase
VKPGGWVFFSTLNRNPKSFLLAIVGAEYVLNMLPRGTHEYMKFIKPASWRGGAAAPPGPGDHAGMQYNPFTRRYWLSGDTDVNYLVAARKL